MSDPIVVNYGFDRRLLPRAVMAFWHSAVPRPSPSSQVIVWLIFWLGVLAIAINLSVSDIPAWKPWAWTVGLLLLWVVALQQYRLNKFNNVLSQHWEGCGEMIARFDETGLELHQKGADMRFQWHAVDSMVAARGGTVFRIGMTMIAIPDHVLPDGMSGTDFRNKLKTWRSA